MGDIFHRSLPDMRAGLRPTTTIARIGEPLRRMQDARGWRCAWPAVRRWPAQCDGLLSDALKLPPPCRLLCAILHQGARADERADGASSSPVAYLAKRRLGAEPFGVRRGWRCA